MPWSEAAKSKDKQKVASFKKQYLADPRRFLDWLRLQSEDADRLKVKEDIIYQLIYTYIYTYEYLFIRIFFLDLISFDCLFAYIPIVFCDQSLTSKLIYLFTYIHNVYII